MPVLVLHWYTINQEIPVLKLFGIKSSMQQQQNLNTMCKKQNGIKGHVYSIATISAPAC